MNIKNILPIFLAITLVVVIFTGCKSTNTPECSLFYRDTLKLSEGQRVYSRDSSWFCLDSIVSDTRWTADTDSELVVALSYRIHNRDYHRQFSTADTQYDGIDYTGYRFNLITAYLGEDLISDHYLDVYFINPNKAIMNHMLDNSYYLWCVFVRDIEG